MPTALTCYRTALVTAAALVALCAVSGGLAPLVDRDEPEYAEVVREMLSSGDLVVPHEWGRVFAEKPPLALWLQSASQALLGGSEFALRLPSALCGGLLVILTAGIAARLGAQGGGAGGLALPGIVVFSFLGTLDMLTCACTALALWALLRAADGVERAESAALGWLALGLGMLAKGPVAPLFAASALAGRVWRDRPALRRLGLPWGIPLALAVYLAWFVPANLATGWAVARIGLGQEVLGRALEPMEHHGASGLLGLVAGPPFYAVALAVMAFPAAGALPWLWRRRAELPPGLVRTVLAGVLIPFAVCSLAATKLPHYLLPAVPLVAVAAAARGVSRRARVAAWAVSVALLGVMVAFARATPWKAAGREVERRGGAFAISRCEPSLLYYAGGTIDRVPLRQLPARLGGGESPLLLLDSAGQREELARAAPGLQIERLGRWRGWNLAHGRRQEVTLVRVRPKPSPPAPGDRSPTR